MRRTKDGSCPCLTFIIKDVCAKSKRKQQKVIEIRRNFSQMGERPAAPKDSLKNSQNGLQNHRGAAIIKQESLFQGGVKFPTGGIARDHLLLAGADLVKLQGRRYSPDERNDSKMSCTCALFLPVGVKKGAFVCPPACVYPEKSATGFRKGKAMQRRRRKKSQGKTGLHGIAANFERGELPGRNEL